MSVTEHVERQLARSKRAAAQAMERYQKAEHDGAAPRRLAREARKAALALARVAAFASWPIRFD